MTPVQHHGIYDAGPSDRVQGSITRWITLLSALCVNGVFDQESISISRSNGMGIGAHV